MEAYEVPVQKRRLWSRFTDGVNRIKLCALFSALQGFFSRCGGKQANAEATSEREASGERCNNFENCKDSSESRYLTNVELKKELELLEKRFKQQSEILERHGLRNIKVPSVATRPAKRYHGAIEPDLDLRPDPLAELLVRVRPERYDDERFEKLDHVVQTFMMSRVSRFVRQGAAASRPVRMERLTIP